MSVLPTADPSLVSLEKFYISINLNSVVLFIFLMGIYTTVYLGTLSLYLTRRGPQRRMVIVSITLLYLLDVIMLGAKWYYDLNWVFLVNGDTRKSTFTSLSTLPGWSPVLTSITSCYMVAIADGLLIWRCFFVWNKSLGVIALPCLLLLVEIVLCLVETIVLGVKTAHAGPNPLKAKNLENAIQAALFFTSLSSSLLATLLIAFRIHSVSKQEGVSKRRFSNIIEIVVQSAAVYSLALLIMGIGNTVDNSSPRISAFVNYGMSVGFAITGIAPTVMVARVCLAADTSTRLSTIHNLSSLQFQGRSTRTNATQVIVEDASETNVEVVFTNKVTGIV